MSREKKTMDVRGTSMTVLSRQASDYISLTNIANYKDPDGSDHIIQNWGRNRNTSEFLGIREQLHNLAFKCLELEWVRNSAGLNSVVFTTRQWIDSTQAIGGKT